MRRNFESPVFTSKKPFIFFTVLSLLALILPLGGPVRSVKAVLSYIFIPQIRASHAAVEYAAGAAETVKELLRAHGENLELKEEIKAARITGEEAASLRAENERLSAALSIPSAVKWTGVWAKTAYRDPARWSSIIIDKGLADGIAAKSAVIGFDGGGLGLAGTVIEADDNTSKILLASDEEFAAAATLRDKNADGLVTGSPSGALVLKYIPLGTDVKEGDAVVTSKNSAAFPEGILIGAVSGVEKGEDFQTYITADIKPAVRPGAVKEVFVFTAPPAAKTWYKK